MLAKSASSIRSVNRFPFVHFSTDLSLSCSSQHGNPLAPPLTSTLCFFFDFFFQFLFPFFYIFHYSLPTSPFASFPFWFSIASEQQCASVRYSALQSTLHNLQAAAMEVVAWERSRWSGGGVAETRRAWTQDVVGALVAGMWISMAWTSKFWECTTIVQERKHGNTFGKWPSK